LQLILQIRPKAYPQALARSVNKKARMTTGSMNLDVSVLFSSEILAAEIRDRRPQTLRLFSELNESQRATLVNDAWTIGLRALSNAHAQAQEARLQDVGNTIIKDVDKQLQAYVETQQKVIASVLAKYFDPTDGQLSQRLTAFVGDQGVLARLLERYLSPQNSVLVQTLAKQVGDDSPLFKKLSPTESDGLVKVLETQLRAVMDEGHEELVRALDPLEEDGAVSRFLRSLRDELKGADEDRAKQLATALAALNANDEDSLINRLVHETNRARQAVLNAVNPDAPESPMGIMKVTLTKLLKEHAITHTDLLREQQARQEQFEKEVREALTRIVTKRERDQKSPQGGFDFEDAVIEFVAAATRGAPCVFEATGNSAGTVGRCKKGDAVLRFTSDSAFSGSGVVFEAKRDAACSPQKALEELDTARRNRGAVAGVFVMARSHAGDLFPKFARYGSNVLVTWDETDPETNPYLHAAVLLGMALVTRGQTVGDAGDIAALQDIESSIEGEATRLDKMEKHNDSIRKSSDQIGEEIRKAQKALDLLLRNARSTLRALNIDLNEESVELGSPITLPNSSLSVAAAALENDNEGGITMPPPMSSKTCLPEVLQ
jgi:hypothetical protein